jgi:FkbM family methyltransferase
MSADTKLEELLTKMRQESRESMMDRERNTFDRLTGLLLAALWDGSLILFGAGPFGRQTLAGLRKVGIEPSFFADNRELLWGQRVDGVEVLAPADAAARYGESACFVVTVYNGSRPRLQLQNLGCRCVLSYVPLLWKHADVFVPSSCMGLAHPMWDRVEQIRHAYSILADEDSRTVFREQLQWRADFDSGAMRPPSPVAETYFPPDIVTPSSSEVFVDCGAFDGDSIGSFLALHNGKFEHIYALEPDPANREMLERFQHKLPPEAAARFTVLPYAVGKTRARVNFAGGDLVRSHIAGETEDGDTECVPLDEIFENKTPTYIKMDIEGAEPEAIEGAAAVLNRAKPVLAACVYHRWEHLWEIPLLIHSLTAHHKIFLRRYAEDCWELVCYAVPESRTA